MAWAADVLIYMNDIPNVLDFCNITLYADDTVLYFSSELISISEFESKFELESHIRGDWTKLKKLTLDPKRPHFILVGRHASLSTVESTAAHAISADNKHLDEPYVG